MWGRGNSIKLSLSAGTPDPWSRFRHPFTILIINNLQIHGLWILFSSKSQAFGLGQTIWGNLGIFGWFISTYFGTVSPLSVFSINQPVFLQKTKPLYPNPKYLFAIGIWIWAAKNRVFVVCGWALNQPPINPQLNLILSNFHPQHIFI